MSPNIAFPADKSSEKEQKMKSFIFQTAHNLKTPIATVEGICNLAKSKYAEEEILEYFGLIKQTTAYMSKLIADLLEVSRSEEKELQPEVLDIHALVNEIVSNMPTQSTEILITVILPPNATLFCDRVLLTNCLQNLIDNAAKYRSIFEKTPKLKIHGQHKEDGFIFTISDNGLGIPSHAQSKIFQPYFRANESFQGHGLGLYLTKKAIDRLGGSITFSSQEGFGSSFAIHIPTHKKSN